MKINKVKVLFMAFLLLFVFGNVQTIIAQSKKGKKKTESIEDIEKQKELYKAKKGVITLKRASEVGEDPCTFFDDDEWYTAFNQKEGRRGDPQLANTLLRNCQEQLKSKIKGRYQAVIRDYSEQMDMDGQSSAISHFEGAGEYVVDQFLNDTREDCRETSEVQDNGSIIMYMSIRVSKKEMIDKLAQGLVKDQQENVRFNEQKFRESAFKIFETDSSLQ